MCETSIRPAGIIKVADKGHTMQLPNEARLVETAAKEYSLNKVFTNRVLWCK